jgi:hypothetical protein
LTTDPIGGHPAPITRASRAPSAARPQNIRAAVTNDPFRAPGGIDGRSAEARRFRDVCHGLAADFGGPDQINEATALLIRNAATLSLHLERLQARLTAGDGDIRTVTELTRLGNVHARALRALGVKQPAPKKPSNPLLEHFSPPVAK